MKMSTYSCGHCQEGLTNSAWNDGCLFVRKKPERIFTKMFIAVRYVPLGTSRTVHKNIWQVLQAIYGNKSYYIIKVSFRYAIDGNLTTFQINQLWIATIIFTFWNNPNTQSFYYQQSQWNIRLQKSKPGSFPSKAHNCLGIFDWLVLEKAEEPEIKLPTSAGSSKKQKSPRKISTSALLTMPKPLTVWITINSGKFWKRWEYQTTSPASWETYMQVRKQQLELDMEQQTGSK